jgi:LmbE family N-acetylglucosaminyl deacetylase/protein-L-isoaspartate O-methyltransferase
MNVDPAMNFDPAMNINPARSGTPVELWDRDGRLLDLPQLDLERFDSVVVVAAHASDEILGAGALIAQCGRRGVPLSVLVVSDGAGCLFPESTGARTGDPATSVDASTRPDITGAIHRLAPEASVEAFEFAVDALAHHRTGIATALDGAITRASGEHTLIVSPWRGDGQHDHAIVGAITAAVAENLGHELVEYPVWFWHWATPHDDEVPWESFVALATDERSTATKRAAIEALAPGSTRHRPGDDGHAAFLSHFERARELFVQHDPPHDRLDADHFDALYSLAEDPWGFGNRWYETRRRSILLASLPDETYPTALEIGSSIGILTEQLAARCGSLLAVDVSSVAVQRARNRLAEHPHVTIERADVASHVPSGPFDLIVFSEVGYFFTRPVLDRVVREMVDALSDTGTLVVCHWRHTVEEYPGTGDDVHVVVGEVRGLTRLVRHVEEDFLLDVYSRDARSVARRTALL